MNKVTRGIKGNLKTYSVTKKSGIKREMGRKNMGKMKIKSKIIELNQIELTPHM